MGRNAHFQTRGSFLICVAGLLSNLQFAKVANESELVLSPKIFAAGS
jgi:hypothetical protein